MKRVHRVVSWNPLKVNNVFEIPADNQITVGHRRQRHVHGIASPIRRDDLRIQIGFLKRRDLLRNRYHLRQREYLIKQISDPLWRFDQFIRNDR